MVFLLPLQTRWIANIEEVENTSNGYLSWGLYAVDVLVVLLLLFAIFYFKKNIFSKSFLLIFLILSIVSLCVAPNKILVIQHAMWILLAGGVSFLVSVFKDKTFLLGLFVFGLLINAWLGIWQFFVQFSFANKWLGLSQHDPALPGTSIVEFYPFSQTTPVRWLRSYGSFDHPNIFGVMMLLGIIIAIWLIIENGNKKNEKILLYFSLVSFSMALFASFSRGAWMGLVFVGVFVFVRAYCQNSNKALFKILKPVIATIGVFAIMIFFYSEQFSMRSGGSGRLEQKSFSDRELYFQQGKEIVSSNWFWGVGMGNYIEQIKINNPNNEVWNYQPVHNVPMLVLAETGIFGLLLFLMFLAFISFFAWQNGTLAVSLIIALSPALMLDHWLWSSHFGFFCIGFIVGIILNKRVTT